VNLFKRLRSAPAPGVEVLQCRASEIDNPRVDFCSRPPLSVVMCRPMWTLTPLHALSLRFPGVPVMLCSAGELCGEREPLLPNGR
jgi:hypothetical protein